MMIMSNNEWGELNKALKFKFIAKRLDEIANVLESQLDHKVN